MSTWNRLIRFVDDNGREAFGEPAISDASELPELLAKNELWATEYKGPSAVSATEKGEKIHVKALLELFRPDDVPIIRCIGLNYKEHSESALSVSTQLEAYPFPVKEGGRTPPPFPSVFIKPQTSIAGHDEDIPIPKIAQDGTIDYEGELVRHQSRS